MIDLYPDLLLTGVVTSDLLWEATLLTVPPSLEKKNFLLNRFLLKLLERVFINNSFAVLESVTIDPPYS